MSLPELIAASAAPSLARAIATDLGVDPRYQHLPKLISPGALLRTEHAVLKWYGLHADATPVSATIDALAREFLGSAELEARGLGFVLLHRCGRDFHFLIVCTWRNDNELWQTVYYKNGDAMAQFALWPREDAHKPTLCVWELAPVWHEQQAWVRFLDSPRDAGGVDAWMRDQASGPA